METQNETHYAKEHRRYAVAELASTLGVSAASALVAYAGHKYGSLPVAAIGTAFSFVWPIFNFDILLNGIYDMSSSVKDLNKIRRAKSKLEKEMEVK